MPGGDRTGPAGNGSKTGRGLGYCVDDDQSGYAADQPFQGFGRGFRRGGRGQGLGRGWRSRFNIGFGRGGFAADDQEIETLKAENQELRGVLQQILDKLDKLGS